MGSNELTDGERLVKMETKLETIQEAINDLKKIVLSRDGSYVTIQFMESELKLRDKEIQGVQQDINELRDNQKTNKQLIPAWGQTLMAVAAVIVAVIALYKG